VSDRVGDAKPTSTGLRTKPEHCYRGVNGRVDVVALTGWIGRAMGGGSRLVPLPTGDHPMTSNAKRCPADELQSQPTNKIGAQPISSDNAPAPSMQIPRSSRPLFRDEAGRDSDMMPATIPR
jgi:hypothetical protein